MAINTIKTRIQLKNDTEVNWNKAKNFIPLKGETIIYSADSSHPFSRLKVGDGTTPVIDLPFIDSSSVNGINIQAKTKSEWNTKINYIPIAGTIIIYLDYKTIEKDDKTLINVAGLKIGDGNSYLIDLPFLGEIDQSFYEHINNTAIHITAGERQFWNNKLNYDELIIEETLIFNRN